MKSGKVSLIVLWHMHQPEYRHPKTKIPMLPWVRMHAAKDYADMPALLEEFPHVRQNFNLTPVLIDQIEGLGRSGQDELMRIAHRGIEGWSLEERKYLVRQCFMANRNRQIKPLPRYEELYRRIYGEEGEREWEIQAMKTQDFRDLIVLFHLAWIDPRWFIRHPELDALRHRERGYSTQDLERVTAIQMAIAGEVIPMYRRLAEHGQIEISTSPFFHPIGPLLLDVFSAREARPESRLPEEYFDGEEDLIWQIEAARKLHEREFGVPPAGIWPPECAISSRLAGMFAQKGFVWTIADSSTLLASLPEDTGGRELAHYLTYHYGHDNTSLTLLFRDSLLSDLINFTYSSWEPATAAADLVGRILGVGDRFSQDETMPVVVIALDGDNAWQNYDSDGVPFLRCLYSQLGKEPRIECCTASEFLSKNGASQTLPRLSAGSWIGGNFDVWMGSVQDRRAWSMLARARRALMASRTRIGAVARLEAWKSLMAAEGSDWTWWYGPEFDTPEKPTFDELFRAHIAAIYEIIGERIPEEVKGPI